MYRLSLADFDIIVSINLDNRRSHLFYINNYGLLKASTACPQPDVDYDSNDRIRISGVDLV